MSGTEKSKEPGATPSSSDIQKLIGEAQNAVRGELLKKFATAVIGGGVAMLGLAAIGGWFILKPILIKEIGGLNRGAVVAFDRDDLTADKCPEGWTPFLYARARTIVGAGNPAQAPEKMAFDEKGHALIGYVLRQHGGEQTHELTIAEMPKHSHSAQGYTGTNRETHGANGTGIFAATSSVTGELGGSQRHNTMQPFIALYYCKKDH